MVLESLPCWMQFNLSLPVPPTILIKQLMKMEKESLQDIYVVKQVVKINHMREPGK
jgi:hypothetical protein